MRVGSITLEITNSAGKYRTTDPFFAGISTPQKKDETTQNTTQNRAEESLLHNIFSP